jgi:hypothetical protein
MENGDERDCKYQIIKMHKFFVAYSLNIMEDFLIIFVLTLAIYFNNINQNLD